MVLLGRDIVDDFKRNHARARKSLDSWMKAVEGCEAKNLVELKQTFPSADLIQGKVIVFDVAGNKVRVLSQVEFGIQVLLVTEILTHAEYDKRDLK